MKITQQARLYYVFTDYFNGTLLTYLPLYIYNKYNFDGSQYGTVLLVAGLFAILGILIAPTIINKLKKDKYVIIIEFICMLIAIITLMFTKNYYVVILAVSLAYLNRMAMYSVGDNMMSDIGREHGIPFGKFRSFGSIGWGLCFLVNGYLIVNNPDIFPIVWAIITIGAIINLVFLKESKKEEKVEPIINKGTFVEIKSYRNAFNYLIISMFIYVCLQTSSSFVNILIQELDGRVDLYSAITAALVTVEFIVMYIAHTIRKKLKDQRYVELIGVLLMVKMLMLVFASSPITIYLTALIDPFVFGLILPFNPDFLKENVPKKYNLTVLSIFGIFSLISMALYSKFSGEIMQIFNTKAVFIGYLIMATLIVVLARVLKINHQGNEEK